MTSTASAAELAGWIRAHRRKAGASLSDVYEALLGVVVIGFMIWGAAQRVSLPLITEVGAWSDQRLARAWIILIAVVMVGEAIVSRLLGPVGASEARLAWLVSSPVDRRSLLRAPLIRALLIAGGFGGAAGAMGWLALGGSPMWVLISAVAGVASALLAARAQQGARPWSSSLAGAAAIACLLGLAGVVPGTAISVVTFGMCTLYCLALWATALPALGQLGVPALRLTARLRSGLDGALRGFDLGLLVDIVAARLGLGSGIRRVPGRWVGWRAVARAALGHVAADPRVIVLALGVSLAPALVIPIAPRIGASGATVFTVVGIALLLGHLRTALRSAGLERSIGLARPTLVSALTLSAGFGAAVVGLVVASLLAISGSGWLGAVLVGLAIGCAGLAGAIRLSATASPDFGRGLIMTEAGPIPAGGLLMAAAGLDVALLVAALIAFAPPMVAAAGGAVALGFVGVSVTRPRRP